MMKRYLIVLLAFGLIGALTFCVAGPARAYEKPKEESAPKEEEQEEEAEDEEAEQREIERLRKAWKRHKEEEKEENPRETSSEQQNPFESIINKQKTVERRLAREDAGPTTQEKIREIRDLLNDLIKQAEEAQQQQQQQQQQEEQKKKGEQQQQQQQQQQQRQLNDPSRMNPAQPNTQRQKQILKKLKDAEKYRLKYRAKGGSLEERWGSLPGEVREDAEAGSREEFPEKYRELLENYYKQLGKRQPGR